MVPCFNAPFTLVFYIRGGIKMKNDKLIPILIEEKYKDLITGARFVY